MIMGTGFPPFRGGLLRYADALGTPYINWVLSENGRPDVAYALLRLNEIPV